MTPDQLSQIKTAVSPKFHSLNHTPHGLDHLDRVWHHAANIAALCRQTDPEFLRLLEAVCYLHDFSAAQPASFFTRYLSEARWTIAAITPLLQQVGLNQPDTAAIILAIRRHPWSIPFRRLNRGQPWLVQILQDADSLDYFHPARFKPPQARLQKSLWGKFLLPLVNWYQYFGQTHINYFLNLPQAAAYARTLYSQN